MEETKKNHFFPCKMVLPMRGRTMHRSLILALALIVGGANAFVPQPIAVRSHRPRTSGRRAAEVGQ